MSFKFRNISILKKPNNKKELSIKILFIFISAISLTYIAVRAYNIDITHDEAYSFFLIDTNYLKALIGTANNHWLNSFFIKIFSVILGNEPWMIRLHSVLIFGVLVYFLFQFFKELTDNYSKILLIVLFLLNLYVLEFFSLARGYGLCLSFLMGALYYSFKALTNTNDQKRLIYKSLIYGILSLVSNYSVFFQFVGIFLFLFIVMFLKNRDISSFFKKPYFSIISLFTIVCLITIANLFLIRHLSNDLRYGGDFSFFSDTLDSILSYLSYGFNIKPFMIPVFGNITLTSAVFFMVFLFILAFSIYKKNIIIIFFVSLFFFQFTINSLAFYFFNTPFPLWRTTIVMWPALSLSFVFFIDRSGFHKRLKQTISSIITVIFILVIIRSANTDRAYEWGKQAESKKVLNYVVHNCSLEDLSKTKILMSVEIFSVWTNYYKQAYPEVYTFEGTNLPNYVMKDKKILLQTLSNPYNYIILTEHLQPEVLEKLNLKEIKYFPKTGIHIYEPII